MQQQVNPGVDATKLRWRLSDQVVVLFLLPCVRKTLWHNNDTKQQRNNQMRYVSFGSTVLQPKRGKAETISSDSNNERCQRQRQRVATITTTPYSTIHSSFRLCPTASGNNGMRQDSKRQQRQAATTTSDDNDMRQRDNQLLAAAARNSRQPQCNNQLLAVTERNTRRHHRQHAPTTTTITTRDNQLHLSHGLTRQPCAATTTPNATTNSSFRPSEPIPYNNEDNKQQ